MRSSSLSRLLALLAVALLAVGTTSAAAPPAAQPGRKAAPGAAKAQVEPATPPADAKSVTSTLNAESAATTPPLPTASTIAQMAAGAASSSSSSSALPSGAAPRGSLHVGPGGITAPGLHIGPDGIALASTNGGQVLDPAAVAAAAAMVNSAVGAGGVRAVRLTPGTGLQFNPGSPDGVTLHATDGGLSLTAPLAAPAPGAAPGPAGSKAAGGGAAPGPAAPQTATVRLRLPVSAGVAIESLPKLAFSIVPDATGGVAAGAADGVAAVLGGHADGSAAAVPANGAPAGNPLSFLANLPAALG